MTIDNQSHRSVATKKTEQPLRLPYFMCSVHVEGATLVSKYALCKWVARDHLRSHARVPLHRQACIDDVRASPSRGLELQSSFFECH